MKIPRQGRITRKDWENKRLTDAEFDGALSRLGNHADNEAVRMIRYEALLGRYSEQDLKKLLLNVAKVIPLVYNDPEGEVTRLAPLFEQIKEVLK